MPEIPSARDAAAGLAATPSAAVTASIGESVALSRQRLTAADGVELSVLVAGPPDDVSVAAGRPVVLALHGFASSAASGWGRTGHLHALGLAGRIVVAPDLRGHGESGKPHDVAAYTLSTVLDDLGQVAAAAGDLVERGLGVTVTSAEFDLVGYSLGSRLAWTIALRRLIGIRRLVLGGFDGRPLFDGVDTERLDRLAAGVPTNDREALRALVAGLAGTGGTPDAGPLPTQPTLVVAGTRDPLATRAERFVAGLPRGEFLPIDGRNHISTVPARAYRRRLVEFLA